LKFRVYDAALLTISTYFIDLIDQHAKLPMLYLGDIITSDM